MPERSNGVEISNGVESSRVSRRGRLVIVIVAVVSLIASACGNSLRDDAIEAFVDQGIEEPVAACIVDSLEDEYGLQRLSQLPASLRDQLAQESLDDILSCMASAAEGGS